jgi:hypothetical protein
MKKTTSWEGIPHLSDLSPKEFYNFVSYYGSGIVTEKLDGSNIQFGMDENGFYTSRETRLGERMYSESDYDRTYATTFQRAVHLAIEKRLPELKREGFCVGEHVVAEVLFGKQPNTIVYNDDNVVVLISAKNDISNYARVLDGVTIDLDNIPYTTDGKRILLKSETFDISFKTLTRRKNSYKSASWLFSVLLENMRETTIDEYSVNVGDYIFESSKFNIAPSDIQLKLVFEFEKIKDKIIDYIYYDFFELMNHSDFGPPNGDMEGVVFTSESGKKTWGRAASIKDMKNVSLYGNMFVEMAEVVGYPVLGSKHSYTIFKKMEDKRDRVVELISGNPLDRICSEWECIIREWTESLDEMLSQFKASNQTRDTIYYRNLQTFSMVYYNIGMLLNDIASVESHEDIVRILVGKQTWDKW